MPDEICDLCGKEMAPHGHYVVRIDVYADPSIPATSAAELAANDFDATMAELLAQMQGMSEQELQDQVHRRFEFAICPRCQAEFLVNPLGKPRRIRPAQN